MGFMYRCEAYIPHEEFSFFGETDNKIYFDEYLVIKATKCGVWISLYSGKKKFINTNARKQFAYATKEQALDGFIKRKERHIAILESQLENARCGLHAALKLKNDS